MLTYGPDTVDKDVGAARERLTGKFRDSYTLFTLQNVIPNAREKHVSSIVMVPAAAIVRVTTDHAVVMVFVNQTFLSDRDPPTSTASDVRVTLEKEAGAGSSRTLLRPDEGLTATDKGLNENR